MNQKDHETRTGEPGTIVAEPNAVAPAAAQPGYTAESAGQTKSHGWGAGGPGGAFASNIAPTTLTGGKADSGSPAAAPSSEPGQPGVKSETRRRWTAITIACALLLTLLTVAGIILVTRPRAVIDQLLILTVPSGADVNFDGRDLGPSPVKLEGVKMGSHHVIVTKEGYQPVQNDESITYPRTLDYKLKLLPPPGAENLPDDQAISQYKQNMEDAFQRGEYVSPYYGRSALYFAQLILERDYSNGAALEMKERVRKALVQAAQTAMSRVDLAQAQEIVNALGLYYPEDEEARVAAAKLEAQIAIHRSDVRELVRKAEDALRSGNLIDPPRASAYYYSKQALTLDRQNQRARAVKAQVRDEVLKQIEQAAGGGNMAQATRELEQAMKLFPDDAQLQAKQKDLDQWQAAEARANDPKERRLRGLDNYRKGNFADAIPDLEYAAQHDRATAEVLFALGSCYKRVRDFDHALYYLNKVPRSSDDSYTSALAAQGDIEAELGNSAAAAEAYKKARDLGGSTVYSTTDLQDKIDRLEKKETTRPAVEPTPLTIEVKHLHGGILHGSCSGTLTVNSAGVRYDSSDHVFASNLLHASVRISKDEMAVQFQDKNEKFKPASAGDAERFREALSRYHSAASAK